MADITVSDPKVADVIDNLGVGPFLAKEVTLGASIWLAAGSQLIVVSAVTLAISGEWNLAGWQRSSVVSVVFVGIMIGNITSGPCSDLIGRRLPIVISFATIVLFSIASAFAPGFASLCVLRFLLGIAFGFSQPAWNTLCTEITPSSWRMVTSVLSSTMFIIGEIYAAGVIWVDDPEMKHLNWRTLTMYGTAPAIIMGIACFLWLGESANWLALQGQTEKATDVLKSIRWWNRKEHIPVEFSVTPAVACGSHFDTIRQQLGVAMGPVLLFTTCVLCFTCFVLNFVYYGCLYAFPFVLGEVDMGVSPAIAIILGALWELPGYVVAVLLSMFFGRRASTLIYLGCMIGSAWMFIEGARQQSTDGRNSGYITGYILHAGFAGLKCFINVGFCQVYQYVSEIYPTNCRVAGTGVCLGIGRIGSMAAPFVFEWMMGTFNKSWQHFFYSIIVVCVVNGLLLLLLPFETHAMTLKDHVDEMGEAQPFARQISDRVEEMVNSYSSEGKTGKTV